MSKASRPRSVRRWLGSTSRRTFFVYPVIVFAFESARRGTMPEIVPWPMLLLVWGYFQYRMVGNYRMRMGKGGPGVDVPPENLVIEGPYKYVRNPMYLGHLIFMLGLAFVFKSWLAAALLAFHIVWFNYRVVYDEAQLEARFGDSYRDYKVKVKRWIPGIV